MKGRPSSLCIGLLVRPALTSSQYAGAGVSPAVPSTLGRPLRNALLLFPLLDGSIEGAIPYFAIAASSPSALPLPFILRVLYPTVTLEDSRMQVVSSCCFEFEAGCFIERNSSKQISSRLRPWMSLVHILGSLETLDKRFKMEGEKGRGLVTIFRVDKC